MALGFPEILVVLLPLLPAFIIWKFYQALARIGNELAEIKEILRQRNLPRS